MPSYLDIPSNSGVTAVKFSSSAKELLAVSCWDFNVRIYDTNTEQLVHTTTVDSPVLDCCFTDSQKLVFGKLDGSVSVLDLETEKVTDVAKFDSGVRCTVYHTPSRLIFCGSWDHGVQGVDDRQSPATVATATTLHGRVYAMDATNDYLVVNDSKKRTYMYDVREPDLTRMPEYRDSILSYQSRALRCFPDGQGFAMSSIEGRVAWEYLGHQQDQKTAAKPYAFKCHRVKQSDGSELVYPIHALAFHPTYGTFVTGGGEGALAIWDGKAKKRVSKLAEQETSISSLDFNHDGTRLAAGVSYMWDKGEKMDMCTSVALFTIESSDVMPRTAA